MKAIVYRRYGSPDVLELEEIEKPAPGDREVLVKVRAASVNPLDWHFMRGMPYPMRIMTGLRKPKKSRLGADLAGRVEAVGRNVREFKPGDEVFGAFLAGAFAEYACPPASALATRPASVSFEQAASVPVAAVTALQALRDKARIQRGQKVLINGAAGGVGTFAVQIAKSFGAEVSGVCSTRNVEMVRSIGADRAIDYTREDFTRSPERYDVILDAVGNHALTAFRRTLNPRGTYVGVGGTSSRWGLDMVASLIKVPLLSSISTQKIVVVLAKPSREDLTVLGELIASGKVQPVIDRRYTLREVPEAIRYLEEGHARGKVVITVDA